MFCTYFAIAAPAPIPVVAECNISENRKLQLDAWKKGKGQSNKENQENNSALSAQMEKLQLELNHMKSEVQKGQEFYSSIESKLQQFLG